MFDRVLKVVNCFRQKLHLRRLTRFWKTLTILVKRSLLDIWVKRLFVKMLTLTLRIIMCPLISWHINSLWKIILKNFAFDIRLLMYIYYIYINDEETKWNHLKPNIWRGEIYYRNELFGNFWCNVFDFKFLILKNQFMSQMPSSAVCRKCALFFW